MNGSFGLASVLSVMLIWVIAAAVTAVIAHQRGRNPLVFFLVTLFFLGPVGPGFALVARPDVAPEPEPRKVADGRRRFVCPRCGAENDIPEADTGYNCWRCGEKRKVRPAKAA